jgi:hypothetical protein
MPSLRILYRARVWTQTSDSGRCGPASRNATRNRNTSRIAALFAPINLQARGLTHLRRTRQLAVALLFTLRVVDSAQHSKICDTPSHPDKRFATFLPLLRPESDTT